jgi:hypothetical protein
MSSGSNLCGRSLRRSGDAEPPSTTHRAIKWSENRALRYSLR